jgi:2-polyprenyl-3-methyl-5-hydroxy-6-metoxy-1,4-benzoquinol methylase
VRARLAAALSLLPDERGRLLDAGMGGGRLVEALDVAGWEVTGIDLSEAMVGLARRRVPRLEETLLVAPVELLPFDEGAFDAVTALGVLEFTEDVSVALVELARVLRVDGTAVVSWPNFGSLYTAWRRSIVNPLARAAGRPSPPSATSRLERREFISALRARGLRPERELLLSSHGATLGPGVRSRLAAQLLVAARKKP